MQAVASDTTDYAHFDEAYFYGSGYRDYYMLTLSMRLPATSCSCAGR